MVLLISLLFALLGLLAYALSANPKVQELGRLTYFAGLLAFLLQLGPLVATLLPAGTK